MVYYRLNYYVKSGTVTDFAPYNFFIMLIQLLHVKKPNNWYNLEFTYIFKLRNIQSMFTYMYIQHELQRKKKIKIREHTQSYIKRKQTLSHTHCTKIVIRKLGFELL